MDFPHPLPEPLVDLIAERFRVIGEPMRIRLLDALRDGDATVGELAERLQAKHHGVVALITRCEKVGWVERRQSQPDRRAVEVHLTASGSRMVAEMAKKHRDEHLNPAGSFLLPQLHKLQED